MTIRTFADIRVLIETGDLSDAEQALLRNCREGAFTVLGDGRRPSSSNLERTIRADLLRYLILGGCDRCRVHQWGVNLIGAWIAGPLDLSFAKTQGATGLFDCGFEEKVVALQTRFGVLNLNGSALPGLNAQGVRVIGGMRLEGLKSEGEVLLSGAEISGQLSCVGAVLDGGNGLALNAQGVRVMDGVFLRRLKSRGEVSLTGAAIGGALICEDAKLDGGDGKALNAQSVQVAGGVFLRGVKSTGEVSLTGAEICGQLDCHDAELDGGDGRALNAQGLRVKESVFLRGLESKDEVNLSGAEVRGQLDCKHVELDGGDGDALNAQRLIVKEGFIWRQVNSVIGLVDLTAAHLSDLVDDAESWDKVSGLLLSGLTYDNLVGSPDLKMRKAWLKKGAQFGGSFHPQPYQQLARFYRETGHRREAREILIEKEIEQRKDARSSGLESAANISEWEEIKTRFGNDFRWLGDILSRQFAGYGYKALRSILPLLTLVAIMTMLSLATWRSGDFVPNSDVILTSSNWKVLAENTSLANPAQRWADKHGPGQDYETFAALAYGFDVVVPILNLGQTDAWAPSTSRSRVGWWVFYLEKIFVILGWVVTAIVAAAVTGMIRRDD